MRNIIQYQAQMGEVDIANINLELHTRDEIPQILRGLKHIYTTPSIRKKVFEILWKMLPEDIDYTNGRSGMDLWKILVLGTVRLSCNWDYDKLQEIANNHITIRQFLGHGLLDLDKRYPRQTLCENLKWLTPEILEKINNIVTTEGHKLLGAKDKDDLNGRCDSFVVETDVHFPTDINLLWDATRKVMTLTHKLSELLGFEGWRQTHHNLNVVKSQFRKVQKQRDKDKFSDECLKETQSYIDTAERFFKKSEDSIVPYVLSPLFGETVNEIKRFIDHGRRQIDQIYRRCFRGETIPHSEKVFSVFEEHTEWISKGKAGVPQELGLRVCIVESEYRFILTCRIMEKEEDVQVAVPIIKDTQKTFPNFAGCSFDKGFHSPENQEKLGELLKNCVLPKKGKLSEEEREKESGENFTTSRKQHPAIESAINALENHGLDRCPDKGIEGFRRYVGLAVLARNIQLLGKIIHNKELEEFNNSRLKNGPLQKVA